MDEIEEQAGPYRDTVPCKGSEGGDNLHIAQAAHARLSSTHAHMYTLKASKNTHRFT